MTARQALDYGCAAGANVFNALKQSVGLEERRFSEIREVHRLGLTETSIRPFAEASIDRTAGDDLKSAWP